METNREAQTYPDWTSNAEIDFWEPDDLYMEWQVFLQGIWRRIEYL